MCIQHTRIFRVILNIIRHILLVWANFIFDNSNASLLLLSFFHFFSFKLFIISFFINVQNNFSNKCKLVRVVLPSIFHFMKEYTKEIFCVNLSLRLIILDQFSKKHDQTKFSKKHDMTKKHDEMNKQSHDETWLYSLHYKAYDMQETHVIINKDSNKYKSKVQFYWIVFVMLY